MASCTPWARNALSITEQRLVTKAGISVGAKSPKGPWIAWGPGFPRFGEGDNDQDTRWVYDLRRAVNRAAGRDII